MTGLRYMADPPDAYRIVPLDGLQLLFHAPSATTHFVATPAPEILETLAEGPAGLDDLLARMRARFEMGEGDADALAARLEELEAAGLVRRA